MAHSSLLYYITGRPAFPGDELSRRHRLLEKIAEATRAGVDYIQLREKDLAERDVEALAREAVSIIREAGILSTGHRPPATALLINSRTDVALAARADGVQLRSDDVSPKDIKVVWKCGMGTLARQFAPHDPVIGVSCHSPQEVTQSANEKATFAVFAPVCEKKDTPPAGLKLLREACQANIPVLALGGITLTNAPSCLEAGAAGIAAIRL